MRTFIGGARDPLAPELSDAEMVRRSLTALTPLVGITAPLLFTACIAGSVPMPNTKCGEQRLAAIDRALIAHPPVLRAAPIVAIGIPIV
jgi:hypothetical protein